MADDKLEGWIQKNLEVITPSAVKSWLSAADYLDPHDKIMATLCRRMADNSQKLVERMQAFLTIQKMDREEALTKEIEDMIDKVFKDKEPDK